MKKLKSLPPPSLEEVERSFRASEKMKTAKLKSLSLLACLFCLCSHAQTIITNLTVVEYRTNYVTLFTTNTVSLVDTNPAPPIIGGPAASALAFLGSGSNWMVAPYVTVSTGDHSVGGGVAAGYIITPNVVTLLRLDYFASKVYMPSLSVQLQAPVKLFQTATLVPFVDVGAGAPISGNGDANGTPVTIVGAGAALRLDFLSSNPKAFVSRLDLVGDYELWNGLPEKQQKQLRLGVLYRF